MNTKQIDCVLELSNTLNFSRAAENLFISQPSLTYQIQCLENEIGFSVFERSAKGAVLTPAGEQFCTSLRHIRKELQTAVEQGQNLSSRYTEALNICIPMRSCICFLPQIMQQFAETLPAVALNLKFVYSSDRIDLFFRRAQDILFARETELNRFTHIKTVPLYESRFYLITRHDDPLARLPLATEQDLAGRTFLLGGDSPSEMLAAQQRIVNSGHITTLNAHDLEIAFTYVAAGAAVSLAPGFANDHNGEFAWIPFDCPEKMQCVLAFHRDDTRESTRLFLEIAQAAYRDTGDFPL